MFIKIDKYYNYNENVPDSHSNYLVSNYEISLQTRYTMFATLNFVTVLSIKYVFVYVKEQYCMFVQEFVVKSLTILSLFIFYKKHQLITILDLLNLSNSLWTTQKILFSIKTSSIFLRQTIFFSKLNKKKKKLFFTRLF